MSATRIFRRRPSLCRRTPSLRARCGQRIAGIPVPQPFDLAEFTQAFSQRRGRELHVVPLRGSPGTVGRPGLWIATIEADFVLADTHASAWHRNLIILHEIGHILCGHPSDGSWSVTEAALLLPGLDPALIQAILGRHDYTTPQEREAETIADLILERADLDPLPVTLPGQVGITARVAHTLRHPVRPAV